MAEITHVGAIKTKKFLDRKILAPRKISESYETKHRSREICIEAESSDDHLTTIETEVNDIILNNSKSIRDVFIENWNQSDVR